MEVIKRPNLCSSGGLIYETPSGNITEPYCSMPATHKHYPTGAVPGHFNYYCDTHAKPIIFGRLEKC